MKKKSLALNLSNNINDTKKKKKNYNNNKNNNCHAMLRWNGTLSISSLYDNLKL